MTSTGAPSTGSTLRLVRVGDVHPDGDLNTEVAFLHQEVARLQTENSYLRDAAQAFGELAERLNQQLRARTERS